MKSLKIKKFLKTFSVIICSIFIFSNNVDAKTVYNMEYSTIENIINSNNEIKENIDFLFDYIDTIKDDYYVFSTYSHDTEKYRTYNLYLLDKSTNITNFYYNLNKNKVLWFTVDFENTNIFEFSYSENKYPNKNFNEVFNEFLSNVENEIGTNTFHIQNANSVPIENYDKFLLMLYTNIPDGHMATSNETDNWNIYYDLSINGELITNDKEILNYYDYINRDNPLKYRMQFNNDVSPDLKQIVFDFSSYEFTDGSNPVKTKLEIGSWNENISLANYLSQFITGYGLDNIETDITSYFNISIDTTDYLTTKELTFTYTLKQDLPTDILRIKVYYDFEIFDDNYYFNVFDNATWGSVFWNYVENFLVGYKKYEFPTGYDIAIIRSKNFQDLDSFYISDKLYFTNPEYDFNLKLYDFNNKRETYNFASLTQYLINPVYLKIPLKIDETNDIFPVLTKPINNESGTFYLKEDLFVQFINSNTLNSVVEGITEEDFNNNNDLVIGGDIGNLIPPQQQEENLTLFFSQFWEMFEKFGNILSYITACFSEFFYALPVTIQFFLCISFAFVIYKMLVFFIL